MAEIVTRFPRAIRKIETVWIPVRDGTKLAATIWLPEDAEKNPVPAVLEFIPYRRRDFTATGDARHHPFIAGHGYTAVRCDLRGNGDSEGLFDDEYSKQELDDGYHPSPRTGAPESSCLSPVTRRRFSHGCEK